MTTVTTFGTTTCQVVVVRNQPFYDPGRSSPTVTFNQLFAARDRGFGTRLILARAGPGPRHWHECVFIEITECPYKNSKGDNST